MNKKLGMLVYENAQPIDFIGPWEVFSFWKNTLGAPIDMYLISEHGSYVQCVNDIIVKTHCDFDQAPELDYLIIPGGFGRLKEINNEQLISFIIKQSKTTQYILAICTGMFLLHKAGLLNDLSVTSYWRALPEAKLLSKVKVVEERIVKNEKIWIAGGISSGIDLAFEFIAEVGGKELAGKVQLLYENFPITQTYCTEDMAHSLPPYYGAHKSAELPKYISDYLKEQKKVK